MARSTYTILDTFSGKRVTVTCDNDRQAQQAARDQLGPLTNLLTISKGN